MSATKKKTLDVDLIDAEFNAMGGSTPKQYRSTVRAFAKTLHGVQLRDASDAAIRAFVRDPMASVYVRRRRLSALRAAYKVLRNARRVQGDRLRDYNIPRPTAQDAASGAIGALRAAGYSQRTLNALTWREAVQLSMTDPFEKRSAWLALFRTVFVGNDPFESLFFRSHEKIVIR